MVNPSTVLVAQLAPVEQSINPHASVGPNHLSASVSGNPLGSGNKVPVIAYNQEAGNTKHIRTIQWDKQLLGAHAGWRNYL